ncbi:MAG: SOS response-associated peptidase [Proteobacteria bacterium]|nr:SOS response-associated peptidase [Pseudomonadota bacterium]
MCGRFALDATVVEIKTQFHVDTVPEFSPLFNIAPTQNVLILLQAPGNGALDAEWFTWGFIPYYAKDRKINPPLINARAETVAIKPAFRNSFKSKRGVVLMSGYFEWQHRAQYKQPYYISLKNKNVLAVAALWDTWQSHTGEVIHSCCLITTAANALVAQFHDRMPVLLTHEQQQIWLDPQQNNAKPLQKVLVPRASEDMLMYPVTPKMNNWRYRDADAIKSIDL